MRFAHPEPFLPLEPLDANPRFTVPVIFAADDDYVPVLATAVTSMLRNANPDRHYDVIVLERDITEENRRTLAADLERFPNATIRFYDVGRAIASYHLSDEDDYAGPTGPTTQTGRTNPSGPDGRNGTAAPAVGPLAARHAVAATASPFTSESLAADHRLAAETCYRFVIQDALPFYTKVLYLDCDVVVNGDVAELYDTDLEGHAVGAVPDLDFLGNLNRKDGRAAAYASGPQSRLHMRDPFGYFQTGVLVMDLERMRELHTVPEWLRLARSPRFIHHDQDVLNMECEGDVTYLPFAWNVLHDCGGRMHGIFRFAPAEAYRGYVQARQAPKIVHYAGHDKPWTNPWCDFGPLYWSYARLTPFSLQVMAMLADVAKPKRAVFHERAIAEDSPVRRYVDKVAPLGSRQREAIKVIARRIQGKQ
ncbi:glycosyltransferase family 8 protein [Bifidobacterium sp. CP2]|uniref:glycosyltransferase family 8 protein n=1 Tax=Bifidobacterium sp. CP2 TaxID=2809025 RepID=UPI001BDDA470|nr:glycosyltransferase family 8 protein [Bifidobacterium sp. CP2]